MVPERRAVFVAAYSRLVADVWADPGTEQRLIDDPRALLTEYDLTVPPSVALRVVRDTADAEPDLDVQVQAWTDMPDSGELVLVVPVIRAIDEVELAEYELDGVVAGLDATCACCCPCCCS